MATKISKTSKISKTFMTKNPIRVPYTVFYKDGSGNLGRHNDDTLRTFECSAIDSEDAIRQLTVAKTYVSNVDGVRVKKVLAFRVVTARIKDGVKTFTDARGKTVKVRCFTAKDAKMPRWMQKSRFSK